MDENEIESIKKVEKVHDLIKKLSQNGGDNDEIFNEVDNFLTKNKGDKIGFDKTTVNKSIKNDDEISRNSFMQSIESDAKERAERKASAKVKAEQFKNKANDYFKAGDYKKACDLYTKAIEACNDMDTLYTNRAQAYIKLNRLESALDDCDIALRLSEENHKALLHKGKALVRLDRFDEALTCYNRVIELAPNLKKFMQEFFEEAEKLKLLSEIKQSSLITFEEINLKGNTDFKLLMDKLLTKDLKNTEYFAGGLQVLFELVKNDNSYVEVLQRSALNKVGIFDAECKLQITMYRIMTKKGDNIKENEWNLISDWVDVLGLLLINNVEFAASFLKIKVLFDYLMFCTKSFHSIPSSLLLSVVSVLYYISRSDLAIQNMFDNFSLANILELIIRAITSGKHKGLNMAGLGLFKNLVESQRFKIALGKEDQLLNTVIDCLHTLFSSTLAQDFDQLTSVITIIDKLSENNAIRAKLIKHEKFLNDCMSTIETRVSLSADPKHEDILLKLFSFIHNLLVMTKNIPAGNKIKAMGLRIVQTSSALLDNNDSGVMRSILIQVLSQMIVSLNEDQLSSWCEYRCDNDTVINDNVSMCRSLSRKSSLTDKNYLEKVCKTLRLCIAIIDAPNHPLLSCAVKILTVASKVNRAVLFLCCDVRDRTLKLQSILYKEKEPLDEVLAGNICLLFINSVDDTPLAEHLSNTSIMKDLLRVCADAIKNDCRRNAAILAGKLAQSSHLHKNELSRLNGFSIISKFNNWQ